MSSAHYVYAIVRRDTAIPPRAITGAANLATVACRDLAAVTGRMDDATPRLTMEDMLHHEAVVEAVRRRGPALPVRFGTVFRDATSVASAIAHRYGPLEADLYRLGDKVELSLAALWPAPPCGDEPAPVPPDEGPLATQSAGARYMRSRAAEFRRDDLLKERANAVARSLDQVLGARALEQRISLAPNPRLAVRAAYLLDPATVGDFRAVFDTMRRGRCDVRLLLTGPWSPYSFVTRTETSAQLDN
ncbi:MAG: GvpL/GvpF family gas vesicle protein [Gemmatimonadaceae bacterium]